MAPSPRRSSRKDASALPSMSSTFWAIMILASLLIAYCNYNSYFGADNPQWLYMRHCPGCLQDAFELGQLAAGTCEIVTLDRDSSQPRRTIARQTARCACKKGQIAGTTRARPACVDARIIKTKQWCEMLPCLEGEGCDLLINKSGWTCTQPGGRIKTTTGEEVGVLLIYHMVVTSSTSTDHTSEHYDLFSSVFLLSLSS
ncbi:chemokine-like protein TAFA-5 isoform X3 [Passer domesticus]|uniref:chemokine-like protein TAFA-5 isoform X3 n=1 Tax=Passer domesticus TaxID=48849 RepID=UPI0030FE6BD8